MKDCRPCTTEVSPETRGTLETVTLEVSSHHPRLQRKRAFPWGALCAVRSRHWQDAGKNVARRPGLPWDVSL